ncbi:hypothetical protein Tco_1090910 [Tanacetum coccineum]|uniref:Uncharacterized protein n=1 Tax=Tanacetum coccineum TaxID=301880 RepID=A0ABQ5I7W6_9ASTR
MEDPKTKMMKETPYELLEDDKKNKFGNNNKAKITLYNALSRNSQVKDYKIGLLTRQYEKFSILSEEVSSCTPIEIESQYGVVSKITKEKVNSLALKTKVTIEQTSDDSDVKEEVMKTKKKTKSSN